MEQPEKRQALAERAIANTFEPKRLKQNVEQVALVAMSPDGAVRAMLALVALDEGDLRPDQVALIASRLGVEPQEVIEMNRRLGGDSSLNVTMRDDGTAEWQDLLVDDNDNQEAILVRSEEAGNRHAALGAAHALGTGRLRYGWQPHAGAPFAG